MKFVKLSKKECTLQDLRCLAMCLNQFSSPAINIEEKELALDVKIYQTIIQIQDGHRSLSRMLFCGNLIKDKQGLCDELLFLNQQLNLVAAINEDYVHIVQSYQDLGRQLQR